jgi:hypothetical protein
MVISNSKSSFPIQAAVACFRFRFPIPIRETAIFSRDFAILQYRNFAIPQFRDSMIARLRDFAISGFRDFAIAGIGILRHRRHIFHVSEYLRIAANSCKYF